MATIYKKAFTQAVLCQIDVVFFFSISTLLQTTLYQQQYITNKAIFDDLSPRFENTRSHNLKDFLQKTVEPYCIAGKFDGELNLVVWRSGLKPPN